MTLQNLYFFLEILKDMKLGVTAKRLYTSQQALSGHIKRIEDHFGVKLFDRRPNLVLTEEGRLLAREARCILDAEERLFIAYGTGVQKDRGVLKIACGLGRTKYYLPGVLNRFSLQYPAVAVSCIDENLYKDRLMFDKGEVDLALGRGPLKEPGVKSQTLLRTGSSLVISRELLTEHMGQGAEDFIERGLRRGISAAELPRTIPLLHSGMPGQEHWLCSAIPELREFPRVYISHGNSDMLFELCRSSRAMVIFSDIYCRYLRENTAHEMLEGMLFFPHLHEGAPIFSEEVLCYNAQVYHPQFFFDFIRILKDYLKERDMLHADVLGSA